MGNNITFDIIGRDRSGSDAFDKVARSANRADGAMSRFSAGATRVAKAGMFALGAGAVIAGKGLYEMAQSAAEDELAQRKLALTLKNTTGATDEQIASVERWITAQGKALGVADDDLRPALQRLAEGSGDLAEAQRLASLAMDASAGTGRSLKSVSEALLRAQNGAIGGLSRYGIATKDAKGETLSFEEVTRKMAQTFEGQAEKAADTTAGKFARLKLILSETGEEIGAKLIPYASDLADAFLDKGVPAIESFGDKAGPVFRNIVEGAGDIKDAVQPAIEEIAEALGHLAAEGGSAGKAFDNVLLPALSATAEVVGGVVDFIDDLPGPVKDIGVQAALAAYGLSKMNGAMVAVQGSGFVASMKDAEKRTAALQGAAKNAAGIGGILLLTSAFQDAEEDADSFGHVMKNVAGGAGVGAMFGPIGALVGAGAGGGLSALQIALQDTEVSARDARIELLRTQGFKNARQDARTLADALNGVINAYGDVPRAAVEAAFYDGEGKLDADVQSLRDMGVSMDTIVSATMGQADAQRVVRQAIRESVSETQALYEQAVETRDALSEQFNAGGGARTSSAQAELQEQLEAAQAEVDKYGRALDDLGINQDTFDTRVHKNNQAIREHRAEMRDLARDLNVPLEKYKEYPKRVRTQVEADGLPETARGALRLIGDYKSLQRFDRINAIVSAPGVDLTAKQVRKLHDRYDLTPKQIRTLIGTEGLPFTVKQILGLQKEIEETDRKRPKPKFDADIRSLEARQKHARDLLSDLDRAKATPKADLDLTQFNRDRSSLLTSLNTIPDEDVNVWLHRRTVGGGGDGTGGGANLGLNPRTTPRTIPDGSGRFAVVPTVMRSPTASATHAAPNRRIDVRVQIVPGEMDLSKAKVQIDGIAREVFTEEFHEERRFERTQR